VASCQLSVVEDRSLLKALSPSTSSIVHYPFPCGILSAQSSHLLQKQQEAPT
jgi:hypothetical protein